MIIYESNNTAIILKGDKFNEFSNQRLHIGKATMNDYQKYENGLDGIVISMTANKYLSKCCEIMHVSWEEEVIHSVGQDKVERYANDMLNGSSFPLPYIDCVNKEQEGRHRALAFAQAFGKNRSFPILIIEKAPTPTIAELQNYIYNCLGKENEKFLVRLININGVIYDNDEPLRDWIDVGFWHD